MKHFITPSPFLSFNAAHAPYNQRAVDGPLQGMTLAVKDLFHMAGLPTTAGNPSWLASHDIPTQTASSVTALLNAGAQFNGKTITDELAYSLNGQNIHYGTPQNPITPDRLSGGSSSGSAVAVSSGRSDIGLGTDTGGSIRVPSSYNGLFGLRPTHGVISMDNMVALASTFDTVGWMTKDLASLEKAAHVLLPENAHITCDHVLLAHNLIDQVAHKAEIKALLSAWRQQGLLANEAEIHIELNEWKTSETFRILQGAEIWQEHGDWIDSVKPVFAEDIALRFEWCRTLSEEEVKAAQQQREDFTDWMQIALQNSLMIIPTTPGLSPLFTTSNDDLVEYRNQLMNLTAIAGLAGLPQLHLPVCELDGAPCGVSLVGPRGSDLALIRLAKTLLEQGS